ncbi:unnamed protein product, partial [Ixodes pacificus]
ARTRIAIDFSRCRNKALHSLTVHAGRCKRSHSCSTADVLLHRIQRVLPGGCQLLRKGGCQLLHPAEDCHAALEDAGLYPFQGRHCNACHALNLVH